MIDFCEMLKIENKLDFSELDFAHRMKINMPTMICIQKKRLLQVLLLLINLIIRKLTNLSNIFLMTELRDRGKGEELEVQISYKHNTEKNY